MIAVRGGLVFDRWFWPIIQLLLTWRAAGPSWPLTCQLGLPVSRSLAAPTIYLLHSWSRFCLVPSWRDRIPRDSSLREPSTMIWNLSSSEFMRYVPRLKLRAAISASPSHDMPQPRSRWAGVGRVSFSLHHIPGLRDSTRINREAT